MSQDHPDKHQNSAKPLDEAGRLAALYRYEILDSDPEKEFTDIVNLLKSIFNVSFAAVNLIDVNRQWTKAAAGFEPIECRRDDAFCNQTILSNAVVSVEDTRLDSRFSDNRFVAEPYNIRSYLGVPLTSPDGYIIGALCVFDTKTRPFSGADADVLQNFAKVVMSQMELRLTSRQDSLTGGLTRRAFLDHMDRAMAAGGPVSLLMVDLDHFKQVNDRFGHPVGDLVLRNVAQTIHRNLRRSDAFGRLGGEEFGILLSGADASGALVFAERMRRQVAEHHMPELAGAALTLSMGIADYHPGEPRDAWMERADQGLYAAKNGGRNRCMLAG